MIFISIGCPASIGPEIALAAARSLREAPCVLVGSSLALSQAAELLRIPRKRLLPYVGLAPKPGHFAVLDAGPELSPQDLKPLGKSRRAGVSQLLAVEAAFKEVQRTAGRVLVTGPVSKHRIATCGLPGASQFRGHTEWLQQLDGAKSVTMCFTTPRWATSLVTTHLPLAQVPKRLTPASVATATVHLAELLKRLGTDRPRVAVCSLNPHAGESELLGTEERDAVLPGIRRARRRLPTCEIAGPVGAETAFRKAQAEEFDGVVALYHDQATIPTKLVAFGTAVNVTMGLSCIRTSVDHGTAYDIAWTGRANAAGMRSAVGLALRLLSPPK